MSKINILRILLFTAIIFWMSIIWGFSSAEGEESQSTSDVITKIVVETLYKDYENMDEASRLEIWDNTSFVVRKTGHFGEYAILGMLVIGFFITFQKIKDDKTYLLWSIVVCVLYAFSDELHQAFVSGRSSKLTDVIIDSAGSVVGALLLKFAMNCMKSNNRRRKYERMGKIH